MKNREYRDYLNDIAECINDVKSFTDGMTYKEFSLDKKTINAVVRSIEIVGEAAKHIPKIIRDKAPDVPWKDIVGMRNKITYEHFGVDIKIVWDTAKHYLPKLKKKVAAILQQ